jgi:hypothetical protein
VAHCHVGKFLMWHMCHVGKFLTWHMSHVRNFLRVTCATLEMSFLFFLFFCFFFFFFVFFFFVFLFSTLFNGKFYIAWRMRPSVIHFVLWRYLTHSYLMVFFVTLPLSFDCLIRLVLHMALALEASSIIAAARGAFFMTFGILRTDLFYF